MPASSADVNWSGAEVGVSRLADSPFDPVSSEMIVAASEAGDAAFVSGVACATAGGGATAGASRFAMLPTDDTLGRVAN
ncbi:MAG: hypothetical protein M3N23_01020 [Pseudomonadota bacterium]|nr:hypothetical protein [Pseudomonadota bacterium]